MAVRFWYRLLGRRQRVAPEATLLSTVASVRLEGTWRSEAGRQQMKVGREGGRKGKERK
jgi:hypothetical protein